MNFIDVVVLVVIGMSALIAFSSGFVNVVLWILSWVGAVVATVVFFPTARPIAEKYISEPLIANIAAAVAIFLIALFICAILNQVISRMVRGSAIGALDRSLGLLLGLILGAGIVCCAYLLMVRFIPDPKDRPQSVQEARTMPLIERGSELLVRMVPASVIEQGAAVVKSLEEGKPEDLIPSLNPGEANPQGGGAGATPGETPAETPNPAPSGGTGQTQGSNANPEGNPDGQADAGGYKDAQRNDLNRLIESSQ